MLFNCSQITFGDRITVRQTIDPFVDDIQYTRSCEVTLEPDGRLSMSKIGLSMPHRDGDKFVLISRKKNPGNSFPMVSVYRPPSDLLSRYEMQMMASFEDGPDPILVVAESSDEASGCERHIRRIDAKDREEQIAYLKQLVTRPWNWVTSVFPSITSSPAMSIAAHNPGPIPITPTDLRPGNAISTSVLDIANTSRLVHRRRTAKAGDPNS